MKITIIGGSGLIGSKLCNLLHEHGHQPLAASPQTGVDTLTGKGLAEALAGAEAVVDVVNSPSFEPRAVLAFFETAGRNLHTAERAAGIRHHVALSIVGTDRMPGNGYFQAKVVQERLIKASGVPYTIVRATQFMEFLGAIAESSVADRVIRLPGGLFQPIAAADVAAIVAETAVAAPQGSTFDIAGPDRGPFDRFIARYLDAVGDPRPVVRDPQARYFGGTVEETSLVPLGEARLGRISLDAWLREHRPA